MVQGYSCPKVETELRHRFPGTHVPHYTTITRWLRETPTSVGRGALARWWHVADQAGELTEGACLDKVSPLDAAKVFARAVDIYLALSRNSA